MTEVWGDPVDLTGIVREAWVRAQPKIARTYGELAVALEMDCADPERTLKSYVRRGMPGEAGSRGKRTARFDVEVCRAWITANVTQAAGRGGDTRERLLELDLEIKEREKLHQLARLADVDQVAEFVETCVANSRAILEAIPDQVLAELEGVDDARRRSIHSTVTALINTAFEEMARLSDGDTDPTDDEDSPAGDGAVAREVS